MNEIEAWKATGQRALRIARQRGLTGGRAKIALLGAGALTLAAVSSHIAPPSMHQHRFEHRVVRRAPGSFLDPELRQSVMRAQIEARQAAERARQEALRTAEQARAEAQPAAEQVGRAAAEAQQRTSSQP